MVHPPSLLGTFLALLISSGSNYGATSPEKNRQKRDISLDQPCMSSESGNLIFHTGSAKNIEFRTGSQGRIRVNEEDLAETLSQIRKNKDEVLELKRLISVPQNVSSQIAQLHSKIVNIEGRLQGLEQTFLRRACNSNPCQNSGTCISLLDAFFCLCPNNWQGPLCSVDVNECQIYAGTPLGCQNEAICVNTPGSYSCRCTPDTYGPHCASKFDDCQRGSHALCEHGLCIDGIREQPNQPKYSCVCETGWMSPPGSPACSADIDECSLPKPPCSLNPPVQCYNTPGSYLCGPCPAGWQGNGYSCQDVNECETDNGGCSVAPLVPCINTMGSFYCSHCPPGYEGDGKVCTQVDTCSVNNGGCHPLATCASVSGPIPSCICPAGYTGNGYGLNGCLALSTICQNQNPCGNGQCLATPSGYNCVCGPGWTGKNCTENIDECSSNPCYHGGRCIDEVNGYSCECTSAWTGSQCQTPQRVCGGYLSGRSGSFSYPNNPGTQRYDRASCAWVIRTRYNKILRITFPFFQLVESSSCRAGYLQIHDGDSPSAHMLGKYCGSSHPEELLSSHNAFYFWFYSNRSNNEGGFTVHWESRRPECGGDLNTTYGSINSPGYPGNYPPNRDCYWTISTNPGLLITFAFGTLSLEHHDNCSQDYLEIRDGLLPEDSLLGKYCSTGSPPPLQTSGPYALVHFYSNSVGSDRGFHITYITSPAHPNCGGNYTDSLGVIMSPNWPNPYLNNRQCIYIIRQPPGEKIYLNFVQLDTESQTGCSLNYIEIRDGDTELAPLINKFCGNLLPSAITSNSNSLWVRFKSDISAQKSSFKALYEVACGGVLSGEGVIRSPYYPRAFPHDKTCEWSISQPEGHVVILNFTDFRIHNVTTCNTDYVEIRNGNNANSPSLGKYCGTNVPSIVQSTQNNLYVKFRTSSITNLGFLAEYKSLDAACGGALTEPEGSIASPSYLVAYPHGVKCTWTILIQPGYLIRLTFTSFNLEFDYYCNKDYLEIYDNTTMTRLGKYCGRSVPPSMTSSGNILTLNFVTNRNIASEGFSADYVSLNASTVCSHDYTVASGELTSPNYPNHYPNRMSCVYRITVENNKQIALHFTNFSLEGGVCTSDYLEIRDGGYETSPLLGKYCGSSLPPVTISHSNKLWIKFVSDVYLTSTGFSAYWDGTSTGCGGTLTTSSGIFMSPNYPMPYYHNAECYWLLRASHGSPFEIQFNQFHLEPHPRCQYDYLAVYDGNTTNAKMLGKFCGDQIPPSIRSTGDSLYIKLRTDHSLGGGGFLVRYKQICQGVVIANRSQGILESLNYPNNYPQNAYCNWTIQTTAGNTLNYSFTDFSTRGGANCERDRLKLYDGSNARSTLIGTFCGNTVPPSGVTSGSSLHVVFNSDRVDESTGFQMLWQMNGCGGELSGSSGSFNSPGFPAMYPPNKECHWYIHTSPGSSIQLTIVEFDVQYHSSCNYDVLEIYGGFDFSSPRLAQLCFSRTDPLRVTSTGNAIAVRFKTDRSVNRKGFKAMWQEISGGCGGIFQTPNGEIHSPNYPQPYNSNTDCSWVIQVDAGHQVLLNFTDFDMEFHQSCNYDYVAVHDGPNSASPLLGKFCGGQQPPPITSRQNTVFVRLRSDSSIHHKGFSARFTEACGSVLEVDSAGAAISSPLYPANYPNNQNCSWIIRAQEPFNHVTFSFTDFDIESSRGNCSADYVEIREGDDDDAPLQGRYCGTTLPHAVISLGNALSIKFVSNNIYTAKGFHATLAASTSACGGTYHMERGSFNSPGFPEPYPLNVECIWNILSSPGNRLQLSFTEFQLEDSADCTKDYLEIWEGSFHGQLLGRYCGNSLPLNYTSITGHILWVKFISDGSRTGIGFQATFAYLNEITILGISGQIASPLWPRNYPHYSDYKWMISVNTTQVIKGRIQQMDIEDGYSFCLYDQLRIYDGPSIDSPLVATYCGTTPRFFTSYGNAITFRLTSDSSYTGKGFLLDWHAVETSTDAGHGIPIGACGGFATISEVPLMLFSPGWPSNYGNFANCMWVITAPDSTVQFNILTLDIESHSSCDYDKLVFRDGDNSDAPILSTVCGREVPGPIRSTGDSMFIQFTSDASVVGAGFNASIHKSCGGSLHADRGVVVSPNYPQMYPNNLNCSWHVLVTSGFIIGVHFEQPFQVLNDDASCNHGDYIELRNGPNLSAPPLGHSGGNGRFCGSSSFSTMYTTDNQLFVQFSTDSSNGGQGFKLKFEAKSLACGGHIYINPTNPSGFVSSPNYPGNYPPHADCVWIIIAPYGEVVQLQFEAQFDIEPSQNCELSYLELRDGADSSAPVIAKLCGNSLPSTQRSSGTDLYMRFRSDSAGTRAGFNANYSRAACGGTLTGQNGFIESIGFPSHHYPDNLLCEWILHGPMDHSLTISFETLDIQNSSDCINDYIEIREPHAAGELLGKYCGSSQPSALYTSGNLAYVKFVSDGSINASGFRLHFAASAEECGGELRGVRGTFTSPNYPNSYPQKRKCEWRILVALGRRVTLTISDMNFGSSQNCRSNYVAIYDGFGENTPRLSKLCGVVTPGTQVKSSGNKIRVVMLTSRDDVEGSFRIAYSSDEDAVCGKHLFSSSSGNLTSPGYDGINNYTNNLNCEWVIQNPYPSTTTVYLFVQEMMLEQDINCQNDYIEVRLGDSNGQLVKRLCGHEVPSMPLVIAAPQIWIQFLSNNKTTDKGFFIHYSSMACGGVQEALSGVISSPNYPEHYNTSSHCSWLLIAPEGHTISLTFEDFAIESHVNCEWDSVTILNGGSHSSPIIGRYCGNRSPGTIQSGSNQLLINFVTDHSVQGDGFYATWTADTLGCGGIIHSENVTIRSPHWPENFPSNIRCTWTIISHVGKHLEINFDENFQIPDSTGQCRRSYVKVLKGRDNEQEEAVLLAKRCGHSAPGSIVAPGNVVTTVFQSQDTLGRGFSATFISRCGANFTAPSGRIVSPNFPNQYENNLNCNYIIEAEPTSIVIIRFEKFDLQSHTYFGNCIYDGVNIIKGNRVDSWPVETFCGNDVPGPISIIGTTILNFYTDSAIAGTGFVATYGVISCGGVFLDSSGTISSPAFSFTDYHHNMNCSYNIRVGNNKTVALKFNNFDLEASSSCSYDYVAVYDGPNTVAPLLGKFCGRVLPPTIKSSTNNLLLVFKTDDFGAGRGWKAAYRETIGPHQGCGGFLTSSNYSFASPDADKDGKYDKDLECVWIITAPINQRINLTFNTFQLEASSFVNCRYDYVNLYDGSSENEALVGSFCGSSIPAPFLSSSNTLTVKFVTDRTVERAGFNVTFTVVDRLCGGIYNATSASQTATSPFFPNAYPPFTVCTWVIDAPPAEQVKLVVQKFHLQPNQDCSQNYLEFRDSSQDNQEHADRVHRFCGSDNFTIPEFYSYTQTAIVIFKSEAYMTNNGLSFSYQASGCSREYNQTFGYLKSPGWPDPYPHNMDCTIILRSLQNHTISLFFSSFKLEDNGCDLDFLEVRNGSDANAPLLGKYCGSMIPDPVFPKNHVLYLHFKSDVLVQDEGYQITWTSSPTECGGTLYGEAGSLASPEYPASYKNHTDCEWTVKAPKGRVVTIKFLFMNIYDPDDCNANYLKVYNGPNSTYPSIGPFCVWNMNSSPFRARSNEVFIKFHSEYVPVTWPSGFLLSWNT